MRVIWNRGLLAALLAMTTVGTASIAAQTASEQAEGVARRVKEARERAAGPDAAEQDKLLIAILDRLDQVDRELVRLKVRQEHLPAEQQTRVHVVPEPMAVGTVWDGNTPDGQRIFALQIRVANLTSEDVTIRRSDVRLKADDQFYPLQELEPQVRNQGLQIGGQYQTLSALTFPEEVVVPAGGVATPWAVFGGLPQTAETPALKLEMQIGKDARTIDLNEFARGMLQLTVERIGPREALGLLTIGGKLDAVNAGALVGALEELARARVARVVIRWPEKAEAVDPQVLGWLQQAADRAGQGPTTDGQQFHLPSVPAAIRELHLAQVPEGQANYYGGNTSTRIHGTDSDAVFAALATAFETLPADELLVEIEKGHPLSRPAALAAAGRLRPEHLPLVLRHAESEDEDFRRAAIVALGHFGEAEALNRLVEIVRSGEEPWDIVAVESLAASRFAAAQRALHDWLEANPGRIDERVVAVLARHPHPLWAETIFEFARKPDSPLGIGALRALLAIGHPQLPDLLERAMQEGSEEIRREVFLILIERDDDRSEEMAIEYAVEELRKAKEFDGELMQFLNRARDPRVVEPLLDMLREKESGNRQMVIHTLAQIGDQRVAEVLIELYPTLKPHEKAAALNALLQLQSPDVRQLAGKALSSSDQGLLSTATQALAAEGSDEAVRLLVQAFESTKDETAWNYLANALGSVGSAEARDALRRARDSTNANRRQYAVSALENLKHRSPAYQYVWQGMESIRQGELDRALKQFSFVIRMDTDLPDGYAFRGSLLAHAGKVEEARRDFEKALQLDPYSVHATAGLAIVTVMEGKIPDGIRQIERARDKFQNFQQAQFTYRAAAVYGHAMQQALRDKDDPDREKTAAEYKQKALQQLEEAVQLNPYDHEFMRHDPDLKPLAGLQEFKTLFGETEAAAVPGNIGLQVVDVQVE